MTVSEAVKILMSFIKGRVLIGYWETAEKFIFQTKGILEFKDCVSPAQYVVVKSNGSVYATNPVRDELDPKKMRHFFK